MEKELTANAPTSGWISKVIDFLSRNTPSEDRGASWDHMFSSAYQFGCMSLVALGQADETASGATPRRPPKLPDMLPRWDDICVAVLALAHQQHQLSYRLPDGSIPYAKRSGFQIDRVGPSPPPAPNIAAAHGLGLAHAAPEALDVLRSLGLVVEGAWSEAAELVMWRCPPSAWQIDVTTDPRFAAAVRTTFSTIPLDISTKINRLVAISQADVAKAVAQSAAHYENLRAKHGPKAKIGPPHTPDQARRSLIFVRRGELDWLFFRGWRLPDGWLIGQEGARALEIFHDSLGIAMRRAVVARLHPDKPEMAER